MAGRQSVAGREGVSLLLVMMRCMLLMATRAVVSILEGRGEGRRE